MLCTGVIHDTKQSPGNALSYSEVRENGSVIAYDFVWYIGYILMGVFVL